MQFHSYYIHGHNFLRVLLGRDFEDSKFLRQWNSQVFILHPIQRIFLKNNRNQRKLSLPNC